MTTRSRATFLTIRSEGAILPSDLLRRIVDGDRDLDGLTPAAYHLVEGERINEAINRAWSRLLGLWAGFRGAVAKLPPGDPATGLTRDRWLLPLFQELGYGRLQPARAIELNGKQYAISHAWGHVPIHLVGCGVDLDRRAPGVAGAARGSPHSLLQEVLNGADTHLWGFVSNGLRLRVLRDNVRLTRQAYVEFDLEAMFEGQVYADFALLWLLCHQSRVEAERPEQCWLERWSRAAQEQGVRALDQLRDGVERAITALGRGFLAHPANGALRERLRSGALSAQDYYRQALRLVYRLLFLFVAEERDLLLDPRASAEARERYTRFYALSGLRRLAERRVGTRHADLYRRVRLVMGLLGSDEGAPGLGLPALGGFLFSSAALPDLEEAELANHDLLEAIRALAFVQDRHGRRAVDYKNLGSEELGSVYESLLELRPVLNLDAPDFALERVGGSERKTSGSYYTPGSLIACLLDTALDPALDAAARQPDAERAILDLKIVDPACGSGHFLIAAAHRLARRLAALRTGDDEPAPEALRAALREVIGRCIYGVDVNPMAVELCKVSLWMEALEPGKPLTFLDHHIRCGNSLIGATRDLVEQGLPDDAYRPIAGDDKAAAAAFRKRNANERKARERGQAPLPLDFGAAHGLDAAAQAARQLEAMPDASPRALREKQAAYERLRLDAYDTRVLYDLWTAAFFLPLTDPNDPTIPTSQDIWNFSQRPAAADGRMIGRAVEVARHAGFFHWELEFPQVFGGVGSGEAGSEEQGAGSGERGAGSGGLMDAEHATGDSPRRRASHPVARGFSRRADMDQPAPAGVAPAARTVNRPAPGA
ncbi:MAG: SAM-dependent methyltransferase, partial [Chloroflexaceae bacterium]|nr:SAM-dependent methyltransferase [Chloroflexaceae bacterium]